MDTKKPWPQFLASFLANDMTSICKKRGTTVPECGIDPHELGVMVRCLHADILSRQQVRDWVREQLIGWQ